jgi:hypothetical protein
MEEVCLLVFIVVSFDYFSKKFKLYSILKTYVLNNINMVHFWILRMEIRKNYIIHLL